MQDSRPIMNIFIAIRDSKTYFYINFALDPIHNARFKTYMNIFIAIQKDSLISHP